jgi:hypothetical protein
LIDIKERWRFFLSVAIMASQLTAQSIDLPSFLTTRPPIYAIAFSLFSEQTIGRSRTDSSILITSSLLLLDKVDRFFVHFSEKIGGELSTSKDKQLKYFEAVTDARNLLQGRLELHYVGVVVISILIKRFIIKFSCSDVFRGQPFSYGSQYRQYP